MAILIKTDKNGTKYWEDTECPRCGGKGYISYYKYVESGRCFKCGGSGYFPHHWKEYTAEYIERKTQKELAKKIAGADKRNIQFLEKEGFDAEGNTWLVLGDTYAIKEELKVEGAFFNKELGWHFVSDKQGFELIKVNIYLLCDKTNTGDFDFYDNWEMVQKIKDIKEECKEPSTSDYQGNIGDKIEIELILVKSFSFESAFGTQNIHKFQDNEGNIYVWKTGNSLVDYVNQTVFKKGKIKGTIKAHNEYKEEKQTELTRCKVVN